MPAGKLSQEQIFALGALMHQNHNNYVSWDGAGWVGVCKRGHVCAATYAYLTHCPEDVGDQEVCDRLFITLPDQDALLATFKLGGWPALVEACKAMIASYEDAAG